MPFQLLGMSSRLCPADAKPLVRTVVSTRRALLPQSGQSGAGEDMDATAASNR